MEDGPHAPALPWAGPARMAFELPPQGTTLIEYIGRRMQKTELLGPLPAALARDPAAALARLGLYAAAALTSFGPAFYQPAADVPGRVVTQVQANTGAAIRVQYVTRRPRMRVACTVALAGVGVFTVAEEITGTTVGWRGLGMPTPAHCTFTSAPGDYTAHLAGVLTGELTPRWGHPWQIRAHGSLDLGDSAGNRGRLHLTRAGMVRVLITTDGGRAVPAQLLLTAAHEAAEPRSYKGDRE